MADEQTEPTNVFKLRADKKCEQKPRLLDQVRNVIRCKHYSIRTEQSYIDRIKRYIFFHDKQYVEAWCHILHSE